MFELVEVSKWINARLNRVFFNLVGVASFAQAKSDFPLELNTNRSNKLAARANAEALFNKRLVFSYG